MKNKLLIAGALTCAAWLALSVNPATVPLQELKPISMKSQRARATTEHHETHENGSNFDLIAFNEYLTANIENAAEREIYDTGGNQQRTESSDAGDNTAEYREESNAISVGNLKAVGIYESEPESDSETTESNALIYAGDWTVTFYCPCVQCCGQWSGMNTTASGRTPVPWYTVATSSDIPFGTVLYIEGFGYFEVMDRGVGSQWADIYVSSHGEIPGYGMTTASVYIVY